MDPITILFFIIVLLLSVVIHEVSHGFTAWKLGDPTAKMMGRLTLNPIKHLDPVGSLLVPAVLLLISAATGSGFIFGWAKPVPFNPYNLRDQRWGSAKVALAGPASNFILAFLFGALIRFLPPEILTASLINFFGIIVFLNIVLGVFNLVPIPPLDGSKILFSIFPSFELQRLLEQYGLILLLVFLLFFIQILSPIIFFLFYLFTGLSFGF